VVCSIDSVRDPSALDRLPAHERAAWQALWREVNLRFFTGMTMKETARSLPRWYPWVTPAGRWGRGVSFRLEVMTTRRQPEERIQIPLRFTNFMPLLAESASDDDRTGKA
jgi:hypothetical protein